MKKIPKDTFSLWELKVLLRAVTFSVDNMPVDRAEKEFLAALYLAVFERLEE